MTNNKIIPNLFRTEYSKIVAVLCSVFGLSNIELAEDLVSETFLVASETWGLKGVPDYPKAWLYAVAKNKAKDHFKRNKIFIEKVKPNIQNNLYEKEFEIDLSDKNITDSQLQMLFAVCDPTINTESQIALALRVLCGFGIDEIAQAFLSNKATINKRLHRAKEKLKSNHVSLKFPLKEELINRLDNVLSIIYLLFNEGYYSVTSENNINKSICVEAMRLTYMLINYEPTNLPKTNALMALLCFHSSRFEARTNQQGEIILYADQNREKWDDELINKGLFFLNKSYSKTVSKYHLEAGISFWHTKDDSTPNKWENILQLYNQLIQIEYSPITALNRTYALAKANSINQAIDEALKINLYKSHLYHTLLAELYKTKDKNLQIVHLRKALELVKTTSEKNLIQSKLDLAMKI
ncbi:RNA polymerase sigma factor [Lutibacter sp.]